MFRRLFLAYLLIVIVALALFGILWASSVRSRVLDEIGERLEFQAEMLRPIVRSKRSRAELQSEITLLGKRLGSRLTVIGEDGAVIADSHADPGTMENHNSRSEVRQARAEGRGDEARFSTTVEYDMMYHARLLESDEAEGIVVRTALPLNRVQAELGAVYRLVAAAFILIAIVGAGLNYLLARWLTRPLKEIEQAAQAISAGDFGRRISRGAPAEFGTVAAAMNRMGDELSARMERLHTESGKLETLIGSMQEGVVALDPEARILRVNKAATLFFNLNADVQGLKLWEIVRLPGLEKEITKAVSEGISVRAKHEVGSRWLSLSLHPIANRQGAVLVAYDITEDRQYDTLRREFVANVSHELRTPLSLIRGYVETLSNGAWKDETKALEFLSVIDKNVHRLSAIVEDLLDLSKLESTPQVVNRRPVNVAELLGKVGEACRPMAEKKRQAISVDVAPDVGEVGLDPDLLERALSNLVENAIKYTSEEGAIRLRGRREGNNLIVSVEDNGIGIPEENLPRIFERFYRVDKSRSRELGGTGLGLAIVKHVVQLHGGEVSVRSKVGSGTTFDLSLPTNRLDGLPPRDRPIQA